MSIGPLLQAAIFSPPVNARCSSRRVAPVARMARTIRSIVTEGSPASILATRDWLAPNPLWNRIRFCSTTAGPHGHDPSEGRALSLRQNPGAEGARGRVAVSGIPARAAHAVGV